MSVAPIEPHIELRFHPTDLRPRDIPRAGDFIGSPAEALEAALAVVRRAMIDQMKAEVRGIVAPTYGQMLRIADLAWQAVAWKYRKFSAPILADAYLRAYRQANAGDVPASVIYDLADKHAEKIGDYFHTSSRDALAEGFTSMVNRQVPAKAAADRVLDAYGLTPRQMRGYTSGKFDQPVANVTPRALKAQARSYIDRSFTGRIRKLSAQEEHNIDEQAKQLAWMWLQDKGKLSERAQKIWITAKDEKVCPVCGPLNGQKVGINEQFKTSQGDFWSPGLHPNCRCVIRLIENRFQLAKRFDPHQPRDESGRWSGTSRHRQLGRKLSEMETVGARYASNTTTRFTRQVGRYIFEPRYLTTPLEHRDREMLRLARGAMIWSQSGRGVDEVRTLDPDDERYYRDKVKVKGSEKAIIALHRAVESAPAKGPELYRGLNVTPKHIRDMKVGSTFTLPMSAFSTDRVLSHSFAVKWGPMIARNRAAREGAEGPVSDQPLLLVLEKGSQSLNISQLVAERNAEWVTKGVFVVTSTERKKDGIKVVHIKQVSNRDLVAKDLFGTELGEFNREHPRGEAGRFSAKARTLPRTQTIDIDDEFARIIAQPVVEPTRHLTYSAVERTALPKTELDTAFESIIEAQARHEQEPSVGWVTWTTPIVLTSPETRVELTTEVMNHLASPEAKEELTTKIKQALDMRALTEAKTEAKPKVGVHVPTYPLGTKIYAVHEARDFGYVKGVDEPGKPADISRINYEDNTDFYSSKGLAAEAAAQVMQDKVEHAVREIMLDRGGEVHGIQPGVGMTTAVFNAEQVEEIVRWYAANSIQNYSGESSDPRSFRVPWYLSSGQDREGEYMGRTKETWETIGKMWQLEPDDFAVFVVGTMEGHDQANSDLGSTTRAGYGVWEGEENRHYSLTGEFAQVEDTFAKLPGEAITDTGDIADWNVGYFDIEPTAPKGMSE